MRSPQSEEIQSNGSGRWSQAKRTRDALDDWFVWNGDHDHNAMSLLTCSAGYLDEAADWHQIHADAWADRAERYRKLANTMRRHKAKVAGDLPREQVRKILDA